MSRRLVFGLPPAVYVIDMTKRRPGIDAVAMTIAGALLLFWLGVAVVRIFYPEVFNVAQR